MSLDPITADSRFLHGEELQRDGVWTEFVLTVKSVGDRGSLTDKRTKKPIKGYPVYFEETDRILVLNEVNRKAARATMGSIDRADWVGRKLTVYPAVLPKFGKHVNVLCVRVRKPEGALSLPTKPEHQGIDITGKPVGYELTIDKGGDHERKDR